MSCIEVEQTTIVTEPRAGSGPDNDTLDVVITAYCEPQEAIRATVAACLKQTRAVQHVYVVDDGSPEPASLPEGIPPPANVRFVRHAVNKGASAGRNTGIGLSDAAFLACVDIEVLPHEDWAEACISYLRDHPEVGMVTTHILPQSPKDACALWRMRFQEPPFPQEAGPMLWTAGHAIMFRREALRMVQGFSEQHFAGEDVDICFRLRQNGWETHYIGKSGCTSIQQDSPRVLAKAEFNRFCRDNNRNGFLGSALILTHRTLLRLVGHIVHRRFSFISVEFPVWAIAIKISWEKRREHAKWLSNQRA